jgi:hypothetical protein
MHRTTNQHRRMILDTIGRLSAILAELPDAIDNLADAQPGYPTRTGGGGSSSSLDAAGNPPGLDRHLVTADPAAHDQRRLTTLIARTNSDAVDLVDIVTRWTRSEVEGGQRIARQVSGGDCVCCSRFCSGALHDRLRAGLCDACRKSWARSDKERGEWMLERRRALADELHSDVA